MNGEKAKRCAVADSVIESSNMPLPAPKGRVVAFEGEGMGDELARGTDEVPSATIVSAGALQPAR